jgi:hypothetical protein
MAKRKKRANIKRKGRATARSTARKRSKPVRGKKTKRTLVRAKTKRTTTKKMTRKKARVAKPSPAPGVETVVIDVVEEPAPGVITVTEFEEVQVTRPGSHETEDDDGA